MEASNIEVRRIQDEPFSLIMIASPIVRKL